jgi:hypothetical protein
MKPPKLPRNVRYDPWRQRFIHTVSTGPLTFEHAEMHMTLYGLQNPFVIEAIRLGAYEPWCLDCHGTRTLPGWGRCPSCDGTGFQRDIPPCQSDLLIGDRESRRVAALIGIDIHEGFRGTGR